MGERTVCLLARRTLCLAAHQAMHSRAEGLGEACPHANNLCELLVCVLVCVYPA
ncbi:MAG: hypothetical protein NXI14_00305 [bacterium]|nr:hypothetical protein [bacterium]